MPEQWPCSGIIDPQSREIFSQGKPTGVWGGRKSIAGGSGLGSSRISPKECVYLTVCVYVTVCDCVCERQDACVSDCVCVCVCVCERETVSMNVCMIVFKCVCLCCDHVCETVTVSVCIIKCDCVCVSVSMSGDLCTSRCVSTEEFVQDFLVCCGVYM